jgi:hypothetical protein
VEHRIEIIDGVQYVTVLQDGGARTFPANESNADFVVFVKEHPDIDWDGVE